MKVVFRNTELIFQSFVIDVLDYKFNVSCLNGGTSSASNINTVIGNEYGAIVRVYNDTNDINNNSLYLYEGAGVPKLCELVKKQTNADGSVDYYSNVGTATKQGKIGLSCLNGHDIVYDCILFDITAHPDYANILSKIEFSKVKNDI